jgi:hypothetical protein
MPESSGRLIEPTRQRAADIATNAAPALTLRSHTNGCRAAPPHIGYQARPRTIDCREFHGAGWNISFRIYHGQRTCDRLRPLVKLHRLLCAGINPRLLDLNGAGVNIAGQSVVTAGQMPTGSAPSPPSPCSAVSHPSLPRRAKPTATDATEATEATAKPTQPAPHRHLRTPLGPPHPRLPQPKDHPRPLQEGHHPLPQTPHRPRDLLHPHHSLTSLGASLANGRLAVVDTAISGPGHARRRPGGS